jgi:hypothetical protein
VAEDDRLLDDGGAGGCQVVGMDVDIPQPRQEVGALKIDGLGFSREALAAKDASTLSPRGRG